MLLWLLILFTEVSANELCSLTVKINSNVTTGFVGVNLYDSERGFPSKWEHAKYKKYSKNNGAPKIVFSNISCGDYAISAIIDLNMNKKLDKNILGMPKEPFGFSSNPDIFFGPPSFEESRIKVGKDKSVVINMNDNQ